MFSHENIVVGSSDVVDTTITKHGDTVIISIGEGEQTVMCLSHSANLSSILIDAPSQVPLFLQPLSIRISKIYPGKQKPAKAEESEEPKRRLVNPETGEVGGPQGPEPTRYGDWERKGRVSDF